MKQLFTLLFAFFSTVVVWAQPTNDNCASATALTVGAGCVSGTTLNATTQVGESCAASGGGITPRTVWYTMTATNDSMILGIVLTNTTNCATQLSVYGPGGGCMPSAASAIVSCVLLNGDPGVHRLLTGLTIGGVYRVQITNNDCGGGSDRHATFCISAHQPAENGLPAGATGMDACGTAFNGTTAGGTWNSGSSTANSNLDGNAGTTCSICGVAGNDVPYVTNNTSWFNFCAVNAGTWRVTLNNISGCRLSGLNSGVQASIFTGSPSALTFSQTTDAAAPFQVQPGQSWTSNTFAVAAGGCAYISVDGFAGDECNYSLTLTNMSGGCVLLASHISSFTAQKEEQGVGVYWTTAQEINTDYFVVEKSKDGIDFVAIGTVAAAGNSLESRSYQFSDPHPWVGGNYYRLRQVYIDGNQLASRLIAVEIQDDAFKPIQIYPNPVGDMLGLEWMNTGSAPILLMINDFTGKELRNQWLNAAEGLNNTQVDISDLPKGMYLLRLSNERNYKQMKFLKE